MTNKTEGLEVVAHEFQGGDGKWYPFIDECHYENTKLEGSWPIRELVELSSAQAALAAREQYHDAYVEGVLESYAELGHRITQLEAALAVARDAINAEMDPAWECNSYHQKLVKAIAAIDSVGVTKT